MTGEPTREAKMVSGDAVIAVREDGSGAEAVLFSHGLFSTMALFDAPVGLMAGRRRCIRWDQRGQGASTGGSGWGRREYFEQLYFDALKVIDRFGVTSCHWVGQSIGAYVGMRLAANHPDTVRSLVLLSPRVRANPVTFRLRVEALADLLVASSHSPLKEKIRDLLVTQIMDEILGSTFMGDPARTDSRDRFRRDLSRRLTPAVVPAILGTIWYPRNQPAMIAEITAPTLIVTGEDDHGSGGGVAHAREVHALIHRSTLLTVQGAGHALLIEQPDLVAQAIADFVDARQA